MPGGVVEITAAVGSLRARRLAAWFIRPWRWRGRGLYLRLVGERDGSSPPVSAIFTPGMSLGGGIASVSRSLALATVSGEEGEARGGPRLYGLHDALGTHTFAEACPWRGYGGSRIRMLARMVYELLKPGSRVVVAHLRLARFVGVLPWVRPYMVWLYGLEVENTRHSRLVRRGLRRAESVVAISDWTRSRVLAELPEMRERTHVIHPCIEPSRVKLWTSAEEACAEDGDLYPTAIIVGRMPMGQPGKGHEALIRAWPRVRESVSGAGLFVVGEGDDRERLESLAEWMGADGITFLGAIDEAELGIAYRRSHVFVMPSRQDGFGIVYAEAMWHGLPCIASNGGGAGAAIEDGETGILVDPEVEGALADAVVRLFSDSDMYAEMSRSARYRARSYFTLPRFRDDVLRVCCGRRWM